MHLCGAKIPSHKLAKWRATDREDKSNAQRNSRMICSLPLEIQVTLLKLSPDSCLKLASSHFYLLYNDLFYDKLIQTFGEDVITIIAKTYPWLRTYIKSLDSFRFVCRDIIASRLNLTDLSDGRESYTHNQLLQSMYIKDSWKYVFSLFKNKRMFAEYSDYKIDEPSNYVFNHFVEINRTYLLSYSKSIWLAPGKYNLNIGLVIKHGSGLGTTKFEVKFESETQEEIVQTFYPPSNINDILPKKQFCFLKVGEFCIPEMETIDTEHPANDEKHHNRLFKVQLTMEEIGLYLKSGFRIFFIDISQPSTLFNDYDLLYYSCQETDYKYFINLPLKNFYKALNHVQTSGDDNFDSETEYGQGDPLSIASEYEMNFDINSDHSHQSSDVQLMNYADFFFKNTFNQRYFKFNTVYQRRQFINRFGDFDLDCSDRKKLEGSQKKSCVYDSDGLKWRIPIVGEL